jgi:hypothetical protein
LDVGAPSDPGPVHNAFLDMHDFETAMTPSRGASYSFP